MVQVVGGRYALVAHLGGGLVSDVSLAKEDGESDLAKVVVVKRLKLGADAEAVVVTRFNAEARLALRLEHPNIVRAVEASEDDDGPFLILEYLEGVSLARIRSRAHRRAGGLPSAIALHIVKEVATGLAYAHALKDEAGKPLRIVHRDVSPENILVTYDGTAKLIDFGVAIAAVPANDARAGALKGNLAYVAPEQARAGVNLDPRADVFALGIVLWELLAGKRMWEGMSEVEVLARLADDTPLPAVRTIAPNVPEALDAVCAQALAKVRDDRFDSALELFDAIDKASSTPELRATTSDVAELVRSLFQDEHDKMRAIVEEALARPVDTAEPLPRLSAAPPAGAAAFVDVESDPNIWVGAGPAPSAPGLAGAPAAPAAPARPAAPVVEILRIEQGPSPDRRFAYAMGAAIVVAFAVVAIVAMTRSNKDDPKDDDGVVARRRLQPTEPAATTSAPPAASVFAEPEEITVEIRVTPPTAHIFVDGVKASDNPHRVKVVRGKFPHEIRAEAEGFAPYATTIAFDRDRTIDVALPRKPFGASPGPTPPGSAARTAPTPPGSAARTAPTPTPTPTPVPTPTPDPDPAAP